MLEFNKINTNNIGYSNQANSLRPVTSPVGIFASNVNRCDNSSSKLSKALSQRMYNPADFEPISPTELKLMEFEKLSLRKLLRDSLGKQYSKRQKESSDLLQQLLDKALSGDYDSYKLDYDIIFGDISSTIDYVDNFSEDDYKKFINSLKTDFKNISSKDYIEPIELKNRLNKLEQKSNDFYSASLLATGKYDQDVESCFRTMGQNLDDAKARYKDILNNDGVLSDLVHFAFEKDINQSFEKTETDTAALKKIKDNPVEFCREFRLRTGVNFSITNLRQMEKDKEAFSTAQIGEQARLAKDILKNDLPQQIKHEGETLTKPNSNFNLDSFENQMRSKSPDCSNLEKALFKFYGDKEASLRWIETRSEKLGLGSLSAKEKYEKLSKQFRDEMSVIEKEGLKGKNIDYYKEQYKNSMQEALGRNIPEEKLNAYLNTKAVLAVGAQIGVAAITGGSSLAGTAIAMGGTSLVGRTVDQLTSKNGITAKQSLEFLGDAVMETILTYGVGKVMEVGLSKLLAKTQKGKNPFGEKAPAPTQSQPAATPPKPTVSEPVKTPVPKTEVKPAPTQSQPPVSKPSPKPKGKVISSQEISQENIASLRDELTKKYGKPTVKQSGQTQIEIYSNGDEIITLPNGTIKHVKKQPVQKATTEVVPKTKVKPAQSEKNTLGRKTQEQAKKKIEEYKVQYGNPREENGLVIFDKPDGSREVICQLSDGSYEFKTVKPYNPVKELKNPDTISQNTKAAIEKNNTGKTLGDKYKDVYEHPESVIDEAVNDASDIDAVKKQIEKMAVEDLHKQSNLPDRIKKQWSGQDGSDATKHVDWYAKKYNGDRVIEVKDILQAESASATDITDAMGKAVDKIKDNSNLSKTFIRNGKNIETYFYPADDATALCPNKNGVIIMKEADPDGIMRYTTVQKATYKDFIGNFMSNASR